MGPLSTKGWVKNPLYLIGGGRPALLPVGEERAVERLGIRVGVGAGRGQELRVVRENGGARGGHGDVSETSRDERAGRPEGAEHVERVLASVKTCSNTRKSEHNTPGKERQQLWKTKVNTKENQKLMLKNMKRNKKLEKEGLIGHHCHPIKCLIFDI